jgi:hypothetical protein
MFAAFLTFLLHSYFIILGVGGWEWGEVSISIHIGNLSIGSYSLQTVVYFMCIWIVLRLLKYIYINEHFPSDLCLRNFMVVLF